MSIQANTAVTMAAFVSFMACSSYTAAFVPNRKKSDNRSEEDEPDRKGT
jgi:hypothetical protein